MSVDADGDFVVVWLGPVSGSALLGVHAQRYNSNGGPLGGEFQIDMFTTVVPFAPSVSLDADGDFVVVWGSDSSYGNDTSFSVRGQRYASDGTTLGSEFQVNTYTTNDQRDPAVSLDAEGDFVVVWASNGSSGTDSSSWSVQGQRYASDGTPLGGEFQVNTYITTYQGAPAVSSSSNGGFVVVWEGNGSTGTDYPLTSRSVQGQRYASNGTPIAGQFQVNTYTPGSQENPAVSLDAGGSFVVVWESQGSSDTDSSLFSIQAQRYTSSGAPVGGEFQVNAYTTDSQTDPSVSLDVAGGFVVVWSSDGSSSNDSDGRSIQGQRYASNGDLAGEEFQINTATGASQRRPAVSLEADGDFVVVWDSPASSGTDSSSSSIQGQRYADPLFADGFESGNTSAWSASTP